AEGSGHLPHTPAQLSAHAGGRLSLYSLHALLRLSQQPAADGAKDAGAAGRAAGRARQNRCRIVAPYSRGRPRSKRLVPTPAPKKSMPPMAYTSSVRFVPKSDSVQASEKFRSTRAPSRP